MTTLDQWLALNADVPLLERHLLASHALQCERAELIAHPERNLDRPQLTQLDTALRRWRDGEPIAYITGTREFWSLELAVSHAVLVPRPETELLVELALVHVADKPADTPLRIVDLGTGSGAVIVAIGHELRQHQQLELLATDRSASALQVAQSNADRHRVRVEFLQRHWLRDWDRRCDLILSNPPYVAANDAHLPALRHEPQGALVAGTDGLDDLAEIIANAPHALKPGGRLLVEHGADQAEAVRGLLCRAGFDGIQTHSDLAGQPRVSEGVQHG